jgi:Fic-DOC domain mobile mystery protein B
MSRLHDQPNDATPLSANEREGLIPSHVTLHHELNELEQQNILQADGWVFSRKRNPVDEPFGRNLHRRMFGKVWRWAGTYRETNKNLGVDRMLVRPRLYQALDDTKYWIERGGYPPDELAVRFHHALVFIHPFPNGNGRWSRLMGDILVVRLGHPRFSWGGRDLRTADEVRATYIDALHKADEHNFGPLIAFARS